MKIKEEIFILLIIGMSACATSMKCPPLENIPTCNCHAFDNSLYFNCIGEKTIQDYTKLFQENNIVGNRLKLRFRGLDKDSSIPSRIFEGYNIIHLEFDGSKSGQIKKWADEEGGPAFVGLEDTLVDLHLYDIVNAPRKYDDYEQEKAPMSLGHLRKLLRVWFTFNDFNTFANGWFDKGPSSLEYLELHSCKIHHIGDRAFADLSNLKDIEISHNEFESLSRSMFPNPANQLRKIVLSKNKLNALPEDMFTNMPALTDINLEGNPISHLPENVWRPVWSKLDNLNLLNTLLNCDDHINWMFDVKPPKRIRAKCIGPKDREDVDLEKLIKEKQREY